MSCCVDQSAPVCPCGQFVHPRVLSNPPGLDAIAYRPGDYASFRHALLLPRAGESQLTRIEKDGARQVWRPGAHGDLAVQLIEWWAYLAEILSFYNERVARQAYMRTADLPESVNRLIRLLGYRPRPAIGASGLLAALAAGPAPFTLPAGFQVQSKPGPGHQPQVFELEADLTITPPIGPPGSRTVQGIVDVEPVSDATDIPIGPDKILRLAGTASTIKAGDRVLILPIDGAATATGSAVATVGTVAHAKDAMGQPMTVVTLGDGDMGGLKGDTTGFHLLRSDQSAQVWPYPAAEGAVVGLVGQIVAEKTVTFAAATRSLRVDEAFSLNEGNQFTVGRFTPVLEVHLASVVRGIKAGDPIVFEFVDGSRPAQYANLRSTTEVVWYANPKGSDPTVPPNSSNPPIPAIAIPHTLLTFGWGAKAPPDTMNDRPNDLVRYGWKDVGPLVVPPAATVGGPGAAPLKLQPSPGQSFALAPDSEVLVQDAIGNGAVGIVDGPTLMHLDDPIPVLVPPLQALVNLLPVSRGKTVSHEVLGSGNARVAGQDFVLKNAPVTYLTSPDSISGERYASTVRVWVNQVEWKEVRTFYGQLPGASVFMTREDEQDRTHVVFAAETRLPTGVDNVVASYRYGSGAEAPAPSSLTVVLQPRPGLRAVRNPVPVSGGSDPDPPGRVRTLAPRSVLTFDRAVSVDDFEAIAGATPGVARARAAVAFDPLAQRPRITVWVGDDPGAVDAARAAFAAAADPNRLPLVAQAHAVVMTLGLTIVFDPRRDGPSVRDAVRKALVDPDAGLLGLNAVGIGEAFYDSQVYAACLAVPGVVAVHSLDFAITPVVLGPEFSRTTILRNPAASVAKAMVAYQAQVFRVGKASAFVVEGIQDLTVSFPGKVVILPVKGPEIQPITALPKKCGGHRHDPGPGSYLFLHDDVTYLSLGLEPAS